MVWCSSPQADETIKGWGGARDREKEIYFSPALSIYMAVVAWTTYGSVNWPGLSVRLFLYLGVEHVLTRDNPALAE